MTTLSTHTEHRPDYMADVPGACEVPLTRAVIQYRDVHELSSHGGRIQDIGLGLVLEGRFASAARVLDLGSGEDKILDLGSELVVLDWVYEPTLDHVHELLARIEDAGGDDNSAAAARSDLTRYTFDIALRVLDRVGFGPLTRSTILRIGFRDICRDLDLHEGTAVRVLLADGGVGRVHLDYDAVTLVVRTGRADPDSELEDALGEAFSYSDLRRELSSLTSTMEYQIRLPLPVKGAEAQKLMERIRLGLGHLLATFEPDRYRAVEGLLGTFGTRETLARLHVRKSANQAVSVHSPKSAGGPVVH